MKILDMYRKIRKGYVNHIWDKYHQISLPPFLDYEILKKQREYGYYSQVGQDFFLYHLIFHGKNDGFFLDIGGNNPIELSNTYFFEKMGWHGYAFEPQQSLCNQWSEKRSTTCLPYAVGDVEKEVSFVECESNYMSGVVGYAEDEGKIINVSQIAMKNWLKANNITYVDFVSIDVEGYEMNVLKGIDFNQVDIKCILLENNKKGGKPDRKIRKFIEDQGYVLIARLSIDDVFYKKEYIKDIY